MHGMPSFTAAPPEAVLVTGCLACGCVQNRCQNAALDHKYTNMIRPPIFEATRPHVNSQYRHRMCVYQNETMLGY
jgi:hypothetical protein